jgi:hypothetical protein
MTLLLRVTGETIGGAAAWLGLVALISSATALAVHAAFGAGETRRRLLMVAFVGAATAVALAHRVNAPEPLRAVVWSRDLLIGWSIAGAAVGAVALLARAWSPSRRRGPSTEGAADR